VPPFVAATDLTRTSSDDEEVGQLMEELELGVSKALGISLLEVHAQYFRDRDEGERRESSSEHECCSSYRSFGISKINKVEGFYSLRVQVL
jgi:hypothetical protein